MQDTTIKAGDAEIPVKYFDTVVIGSGCAAYNAADWLSSLGRKKIAVVTEGRRMGTSRNAGSDKQTYYKLSLSSAGEDSVGRMAKDLFAGGRVHGDTAWAEAAGSAKSFLKLACMNVPFPMNEYGEYVGYQTDHDTSCRATSAGPLTSRYMTEALERAVLEKKVLILDKTMAFQLLVHQGQTEGVLCMSREGIQGSGRGLLVLAARHVILATGGAAGCYYHSVFPKSQTGMSGMALEAGASGTNLDQWQYGLASVKFRWNVSGTYQQVLPRYFSVDEQGKEREFLKDAFESTEEMLYRIFQKGYQWPFDPAKKEGSSRIDLLVYRETAILGRKVYLDYRRNPEGLAEDFGNLHEEAYRYLENSQALLETPIARLEKMNPLAIELYKSHGIDLYREPLEINVCAQHQNGGISVDRNWQTEIKGLYAAGEAAGTFGVRRPGGSALNSAQVGSMRAAEHIAWETEENLIPEAGFEQRAKKACEKWLKCFEKLLGEPEQAVHPLKQRAYFSEKMSACAAHVRKPEQIRQLASELQDLLAHFEERCRVKKVQQLPMALKNRDIWMTQLCVLDAVYQACMEEQDGTKDEKTVRVTALRGFSAESWTEPVRELPKPDLWFENVWEAYRKKTGKKNG